MKITDATFVAKLDMGQVLRQVSHSQTTISDIITPTQAAAIRGVHRSQIYRAINAGRLTAYTIGGKPFVSRRAVEAMPPPKGHRGKSPDRRWIGGAYTGPRGLPPPTKAEGK